MKKQKRKLFTRDEIETLIQRGMASAYGIVHNADVQLQEKTIAKNLVNELLARKANKPFNENWYEELSVLVEQEVKDNFNIKRDS